MNNSMVRFHLLVLMILGFVAYANNEPEIKAESLKYGENIGEVIHSGFFFFNGQYVSLPYIVERKGFELSINGNTIFKWKPIEEKEEYSGDINPELTASITEQSTEFDKEVKGYIKMKSTYIKKAFPENEFSEQMVKALEQLPLIKSAKISSRPYCVDVIYKYDLRTEITLNFDPPSGRSFKTNIEKLKSLDYTKRTYEEALKKGKCVIISGNSPDMTIKPHPYDLKKVIQILNSKEIDEIKTGELDKLDLFIHEINRDLVEHYQFSEELLGRVNATYNKWKNENPDEYYEYERQERQKPLRDLYLKKYHEIRDKGQEYWENRKDEFEKELKELDELKSRVDQVK